MRLGLLSGVSLYSQELLQVTENLIGKIHILWKDNTCLVYQPVYQFIIPFSDRCVITPGRLGGSNGDLLSTSGIGKRILSPISSTLAFFIDCFSILYLFSWPCFALFRPCSIVSSLFEVTTQTPNRRTKTLRFCYRKSTYGVDRMLTSRTLVSVRRTLETYNTSRLNQIPLD